MRASEWITAAAACGALLAAGPTLAQAERSGGGGANAMLMAQYQQVVVERTQLQADNAKLKKDADEANKQLAALRQQLGALKAGSGSARAALAAAQTAGQEATRNYEQTRDKLQELVGRFRETVATLSGIETERGQLQRQLQQAKAALDLCADRNYELYKVDIEVLDRYEHQGVFGSLTKAEPFTRIERTRIENLADEYRQRAEELRIQKPTPAPAALGPPPAAGRATPVPATH